MRPGSDAALLDTSVLIDFPSEAVAPHAASLAVSTITLAELAFGLHTADPLVDAAREQRYRWIVTSFRPIDFDTDAARIYGALCANVRLSGRDPRPRRFDLLIASVAVSRGMALLTRNARDFADVHAALIVVAV